MTDNAAAVIALPDEIVPGHKIVGAHKEIGVKAAFFKYLNQTACVSEGVDIDGGFRCDTEFFLKIAHTDLNLADKGLAGGHIAVGLYVPAAHNAPFSAAHQRAYPLKQRRVVRFDPFIQHRFVVIEHKAIVLFAKIRRNAEGRERLGDALAAPPLPYRVDVRVAQKIYLIHIIPAFFYIFLWFNVHFLLYSSKKTMSIKKTNIGEAVGEK